MESPTTTRKSVQWKVDYKLLDVQQGDSAIVIIKKKTEEEWVIDKVILIDCGDKGQGYTVAEELDKIVGNRYLDALIITHWDSDHCGGLFQEKQGVRRISEWIDFKTTILLCPMRPNKADSNPNYYFQRKAKEEIQKTLKKTSESVDKTELIEKIEEKEIDQQDLAIKKSVKKYTKKYIQRYLQKYLGKVPQKISKDFIDDDDVEVCEIPNIPTFEKSIDKTPKEDVAKSKPSKEIEKKVDVELEVPEKCKFVKGTVRNDYTTEKIDYDAETEKLSKESKISIFVDSFEKCYEGVEAIFGVDILRGNENELLSSSLTEKSLMELMMTELGVTITKNEYCGDIDIKILACDGYVVGSCEKNYNTTIENEDTSPENRKSISCLLINNETVLLTSGDLWKSSDISLRNYITKSLGIDTVQLMKMNHHGSSYNTLTQYFLGTLNHQVALLSYGENNKFVHPSQNILDTLLQSFSGLTFCTNYPKVFGPIEVLSESDLQKYLEYHEMKNLEKKQRVEVNNKRENKEAFLHKVYPTQQGVYVEMGQNSDYCVIGNVYYISYDDQIAKKKVSKKCTTSFTKSPVIFVSTTTDLDTKDVKLESAKFVKKNLSQNNFTFKFDVKCEGHIHNAKKALDMLYDKLTLHLVGGAFNKRNRNWHIEVTVRQSLLFFYSDTDEVVKTMEDLLINNDLVVVKHEVLMSQEIFGTSYLFTFPVNKEQQNIQNDLKTVCNILDKLGFACDLKKILYD
ncbi:hypothetical protein EIN_117920 [Entamoeba invadens IP1]|uniref:Metallo-beta-lactamase domain-containing protein n=1 Tax=Entamoeba invadens IP1 TaxID=370355 RepID=L7FMQ5_ENTIV|nr:hypothetical protein EIN_117920 [Entamoeba invadens IP1]ELP92218.1 hypothetical protein EIN_117920 [Entamoeba invadens IP1]|eukprot:XP_004258989.1 hypothetical protein EIN_117920 [Entamoeba invadens IP1]